MRRWPAWTNALLPLYRMTHKHPTHLTLHTSYLSHRTWASTNTATWERCGAIGNAACLAMTGPSLTLPPLPLPSRSASQIKRRMYHYPNCQDAFINLFCYMNFPRCDPQTNESLPLCRSLCENFFITCGYEQNLWRCGKTKWFNGYFPEPPSVDPASGNLTYLRDYFPGQVRLARLDMARPPPVQAHQRPRPSFIIPHMRGWSAWKC